MILNNKKDTVIGELEKRISSIILMYKNKGMSMQEIRVHLLETKNFKKIIKVLGDIRQIYDEQKYPIKFETTVYDLLFFCITLERTCKEDKNESE